MFHGRQHDTFRYEKWFYNHLLFDGLDLEEKHEDIDYSEDNDDGIMLKVFFKDGSAIRFLDDNDNICSLYVLFPTKIIIILT